MALLDTLETARRIHLFIQALQRDDRTEAMEQLLVLGMQLGAASDPLSAPTLRTISQEAANAVVRELNGVIGRQRDVAARMAMETSHSVAPVIQHNTTQLEAVSDALAALCEERGFLMVQN